MPMTKAQKNEIVDQVKDQFGAANSLFLVSLSGLSANEVNKLRADLREQGARMRVVKNRLAKRAAEGDAAEKLNDWFRGPTAVVMHDTEPVATAKGLVAFAKDHPALEIKAGLIEGANAVDADGVKAVAELPSLDEIRAQIMSVINTPATSLVRLLGTPSTQLARVIGEKSKQE